MNREILFRGKPMLRESNKFVYGYYKKGDIAGVETDFILPLLEYKNEINEVSVLSKTVGQYTGLKDKNGVKIFEGDILKAMGVDGEQIAPVVFRKGFFVLDEKNAFIKLGVGAFRKRQLEIIGNIHDNPELVRKD